VERAVLRRKVVEDRNSPFRWPSRFSAERAPLAGSASVSEAGPDPRAPLSAAETHR
jgi:hypothetical protein